MSLIKSRSADIGNNEQKIKKYTIGDLLIPLLSIIIFAILTIALYVPAISDIWEIRKDIKDVQDKKVFIDSNLKIVDTLNQDKIGLLDSARIARLIVPTELDVSNFTYYVDKLAKENNLEFKEVSSTNISVDASSIENLSLEEGVKGISGPFVYNGSYDDIVSFLDKLQADSPYIVSASSVSLKQELADPNAKKQPAESWTLELSITGYYAEGRQNVTVSPYQKVTPYSNYKDILNVFTKKAEKLSSQ
ncbi:hypothetical protein H6764_01555 [Candidatus Nomurabacteria bacterium]|nr:hypothetical protein [Candidatus Nomurabacteria bacterium]